MAAVSAPHPVHLSVGPEGLAEPALLRALGLTTAQLYPLHSDVIGAPRHYAYCRHGRHGQAPGYYYTAEGVRAIADHLGLEVHVNEPHLPDPQPPAPLYWWQKDTA